MPRKKKTRRLPDEGMIVTRKDGLLMVQVSLGKDADGKWIRKTAYGRTTEEVAEARQNILDENEKQRLVGKAGQKLAGFLDSWLKDQHELAYNTTSTPVTNGRSVCTSNSSSGTSRWPS